MFTLKRTAKKVGLQYWCLLKAATDTIEGVCYGRTLSDASMLYFADVFFIFFYARLSWPNV